MVRKTTRELAGANVGMCIVPVQVIVGVSRCALCYALAMLRTVKTVHK